jgi:3-hydroxyacyl-[acyl-carrier-protein] dehydratase
MKLKDSFFEIINTSLKKDNNEVDFVIELKSSHSIYSAHFPENPITPGVCIIQITKELVEECLKTDFKIQKVEKVKYSNVINPLVNSKIIFSISIVDVDDDTKKISAVVHNAAEIVFSRLSIELQKCKI